MRNETQHTPADVREPTDAQISVWSIIRSALSRAWALSRPWAVADRPHVTSDVVARLDAIAADCEREVLAALRSEAQGDAEALAALVVRIWTRCKNEGPHYRETDEFWADFERAYQLAARRDGARGEDRWEDLVFLPIVEAYNEAHAAHRGEGGGK